MPHYCQGFACWENPWQQRSSRPSAYHSNQWFKRDHDRLWFATTRALQNWYCCTKAAPVATASFWEQVLTLGLLLLLLLPVLQAPVFDHCSLANQILFVNQVFEGLLLPEWVLTLPTLRNTLPEYTSQVSYTKIHRRTVTVFGCNAQFLKHKHRRVERLLLHDLIVKKKCLLVYKHTLSLSVSMVALGKEESC